MSFARDDMNLSSALQKLQTGYLQSRIVEKLARLSLVSTSKNEQEVERVDLSENISKRLETTKVALEEVQEGKSMLQTAQNGLSSILENLENIKDQAKNGLGQTVTDQEWKDINSSIQKSLKNIQNTVEDTTFNDKKVLDGSMLNNLKIDTVVNGTVDVSSNLKDTSLKALNLPSGTSLSDSEGTSAFLEKIDSAINEIRNRQEDIEDDEIKVDTAAGNLLVINSNLSSVSSSTRDIDVASQLKQSAIDTLFQEPTESKKVQIKNLDQELILALLRVL